MTEHRIALAPSTTVPLPTDITGSSRAVQAAWIVGFAVLTAVGAQVEIPHLPVPYTLQTLVVLLAGGFLGSRKAALSMALYLVLGVAGLPMFSGAGFGVARVLGPTGGYLLAFPIAAAVVGVIVGQRSRLWRTTLAMIAGLLVVFFLGTVQLYAVLLHSWPAAFQSGFLVFSMGDLVKLVAAVLLVHGVRRGPIFLK